MKLHRQLHDTCWPNFPGVWLERFLHFIPMPPPKGLAAQQFGGADLYVALLGVIFSVQVLGGVLLLGIDLWCWRWVLLGPVIVNILCFHALMARRDFPWRCGAVLWVNPGRALQTGIWRNFCANAA